jgi:hypothetical protein
MRNLNRRFEQLKRRYAAWMLLAVFAWVSQPVGTALFCHDDFSHGHSAPASVSQSSGALQDQSETHDHSEHDHGTHAHAAPHAGATIPDQAGASSQLPEPTQEACCCQSQETPVTAVAAGSYFGADGKSHIVLPPVAILTLTYEPEGVPAVGSRAGPDVPSLYSQFCRSSFSNRAPPFSA